MRLCLCVTLLALACDKGSPSPAPGGPAAATSATAALAATSIASAPAPPTAASTATGNTVGAEATPPDTIIAQHVLVTYRGAKRAQKGVTRSKVDAKARAQEAVLK